MTKSTLNAIVQVTAHFHSKGEKFLYEAVDSYEYGPLEQNTGSIGMLDTDEDIYDTVVINDFVSFSFKSVSDQLVDGHDDVFDHEVSQIGLYEVFQDEDIERFTKIANDHGPDNRVDCPVCAFLIVFTVTYTVDYEGEWDSSYEWKQILHGWSK